MALRRFGFVTGDGVQWPPGDLELAWKTGSDGAASGGSFAAGRLDLAVIAQIATRLPLGEALRKLLRESAPQGIASEIKASWDGAVDAPKHYRVAARLSGLALDAHPAEAPATPGRPGLRNASLVLDASDQGGKATLEIRDGGIELPGVFDDAVVPLAELSARLQWRIEARAGASPALELQIRDARVANADAQGVLNATWRTGVGEGHARGGRFPGVLDLDATLTRGDALSAARYLPLGISEGARHYVQRAVQGGNVTSANFRIKGDLWDFPFRAGSQGSFRVAIKARDMTLAYMPGAAASASDIGNTKPEPPWPPMTQLSGELLIDGRSLEFRDVRARILGVELGGLRGGIADLAERPLLKLQAQARGPVADMLRFVNTTPVGGWVDGALREATASANGDLKLSLGLPLRDMSHATVNGSLVLAGNDVRIRHDLPMLAAAHGRVDFTEKSLSVVGAGARVLGGDTSFDGGSQPDGSLRFTAQGSVTADALRRAPELGSLARVAAALTGQAQYRLALGLVRGRPEFSLTSDLVGLALDLPAPLRKAAELPLALRIQSTLAPGAPTQDTLRFELGPVVQAQFQRDLAGDTPRVLRGGIGVFEAAPSPASGVAANASFASLDVDAWDASVTRLLGGGGGSESAGSEAFTPGGYAPTQVGMRAQEIVVGGRRFTRLTMGASQLEGQWRAAIDADQLAGYVEYRAAPGGAGLVHARLARVSLPRGEVEEVTKLLDERQASLPALDIVVDDFELRGKHLGRFEVQAVNRLAPEREWRLTRLTLGLPEATLTAQGRWGAPGPGPGAPSSAAGPAQGKAPAARAEPFARRAEFDFRLDLADSGALLDRLGTVNVVRGGKGSLQGQVAWLGSPLTPDFASMTGQFKVAIESGQFLQVQPGAARLLGVLSLQSFARRLTLDFRDLFEEGFAFDSVAGDVAIARGVASTNNLVMRGAQAAVLMEGSSDIGRETQDLRVVVVPEINAGAASLAYAVINPAIGLGTFLAQLFLRQPLIEASTREFHVSGPWADPVVVPVERSGARPDPAPATAAPGASSGAR